MAPLILFPAGTEAVSRRAFIDAFTTSDPAVSLARCSSAASVMLFGVISQNFRGDFHTTSLCNHRVTSRLKNIRSQGFRHVGAVWRERAQRHTLPVRHIVKHH